jgi:membrane fusion protein (multidrug efflux system)
MNEKISRRLIQPGLLLGAIVFFVSITGCKEEIKVVAPPPPQVTVIPAAMGAVSPSQLVVGQVKAYDDVELRARVAGFLEKRNFVEGQVVKAGTLLFLIEQAQYKAAVQTAEAEKMRAEAEQKNTTSDYHRQKELYEKDAVSQRVYEQALSRKMQADAAVLAAQASLDKAKLDLSYTEITAPFDGRVGLANYSVGNLVGPASLVLADIAKLDPVRVQFNFNENDVLRLIRHKTESGKAVELEVQLFFQDDKAYPVQGEITFWNNRVNPSTGTVLLQATFKNPDLILVPGMYVKVKISTKDKLPMLVIPRSALLEDQSGAYVMVINDKGIVEQRPVVIGMEQNTDIGIKSGLQPGENIITAGLQKVRPGSPAKGVPPVHNNDSAGVTSIPPADTIPAVPATPPATGNPMPDMKKNDVKEPAATAIPEKKEGAAATKQRRL